MFTIWDDRSASRLNLSMNKIDISPISVGRTLFGNGEKGNEIDLGATERFVINHFASLRVGRFAH